MTDKLPTIDIKGKSYVLVKDRILYFNERCPNGSIETKLHSYEGAQVVMQAIVTPDIDRPTRIFTGWSQAKEEDGYINKNAALENCESSSVGRALAMMGIGIFDSIASADEMVRATRTPSEAPVVRSNESFEQSGSTDDKPATEAQKNWIDALQKNGKLLKHVDVATLTTTQASDIISDYKRRIGK